MLVPDVVFRPSSLFSLPARPEVFQFDSGLVFNVYLDAMGGTGLSFDFDSDIGWIVHAVAANAAGRDLGVRPGDILVSVDGFFIGHRMTPFTHPACWSAGWQPSSTLIIRQKKTAVTFSRHVITTATADARNLHDADGPDARGEARDELPDAAGDAVAGHPHDAVAPDARGEARDELAPVDLDSFEVLLDFMGDTGLTFAGPPWVITAVAANAAGRDLGVRPGDMLITVDTRPVGNKSDLEPFSCPAFLEFKRANTVKKTNRLKTNTQQTNKKQR